MGKATIIGSGARNLERGQYRVRIEKSDERTIAQAKQIDNEIRALDDVLPTRRSTYNDALSAHKSAEIELDHIIQQSIESPSTDYSDKLNSATAAERTAFADLAKAKSQYQSTVIKQKSLENQRLYLEVNETEDIRTVWCADCQRNLSGEVATIEVPNTDDTILIRPGGADGSGSEYSRSRDGQLRSVLAMSPAEAVYNYALFPGWQKWFPTYRLGKITHRIPGNSKCSVLLDEAVSVDNLNVNRSRQLTNVPMVYKNRDDGGPYEIGDRVVVEFVDQNPDVPRVVGFEDYPCTTSSSSSTTTSSCSSTTTSTESLLEAFIIRFTRGDGEVVTEDWFTGGDPPNTISIRFWDSDSNVISMTRSYDPITQYFTFTFPPEHSIDPNGYWIRSLGYRSLTTFYPATYKISERFSPSDLLSPGVYDFHMPYFYTTGIVVTGDQTTAQMKSTQTVYSSVPWGYTAIIEADVRDAVVERMMYYGIQPNWTCCKAHTYLATEPNGPHIFSPTGVDIGDVASLNYTLDLDVTAGPISHHEVGGAGLPALYLSQDVVGAIAPLAGEVLEWTIDNNCPNITNTINSCTGCDLAGPIPAYFHRWVSLTLDPRISIITPYYY